MKQRGGAKCELERIKGYEAKEAAVELTREKSAKVAKSYGPDRYGRLVVDLEIAGKDVATALISEGTHKAWDYDGGERKPDWCAAQAGAPVAFLG